MNRPDRSPAPEPEPVDLGLERTRKQVTRNGTPTSWIERRPLTDEEKAAARTFWKILKGHNPPRPTPEPEDTDE